MRDAQAAGAQAVAAALAELDGPPDLLLVFGTAGYDQRTLIDTIRSAAPAARLVGCSGEGVIAAGRSIETDHAVGVMALRSPMGFEPVLVPGYGADPVGCARALADRIGATEDLVCVLVFTDGLSGNCTAFLDALRVGVPATLVAGGAAGDAMTFTRTHQYVDGEIASDAVAALIVRGPGRARVVVSHGCVPIGLERTITRGEAGWLHEIDDRPAWDVFREYLDGDPEDLNGDGIVHLCVGEALPPEAAARYAPHVIRTPLQLDKATGSMFFPGGGLDTGKRIRLTRRDPERIGAAAVASAHQLVEAQLPAFVLQIDCAGRGKILFGAGAGAHIVEPLRRAVGVEVPWVGFHSYGEIAPIGARVYYHNYTVVLCALYDQ